MLRLLLQLLSLRWPRLLLQLLQLLRLWPVPFLPLTAYTPWLPRIWRCRVSSSLRRSTACPRVRYRR